MNGNEDGPVAETDWNAVAAQCHEDNRNWWLDPVTREPIKRDQEELMALVISELGEALNGARKNQKDDHLPHRLMEEVEMADAVIRLGDLAAGLGIRLDWDDASLADVVVFPESKGKPTWQLMKAATKIGVTPSVGWRIGCLLVAIEEYCRTFELDLWGAYAEKREYNRVRRDHRLEERAKEGGKKF